MPPQSWQDVIAAARHDYDEEVYELDRFMDKGLISERLRELGRADASKHLQRTLRKNLRGVAVRAADLMYVIARAEDQYVQHQITRAEQRTLVREARQSLRGLMGRR